MSSLACETEAQVIPGERDAFDGPRACVRSDEVCVMLHQLHFPGDDGAGNRDEITRLTCAACNPRVMIRCCFRSIFNLLLPVSSLASGDQRDALMGPERVFALMSARDPRVMRRCCFRSIFNLPVLISSLACEKQAQVFHGERDALMGREMCVRSDEVCVVCCNNCTSLEMIVPETEMR
ncbi:hypothetical protein CEXT_341701 [Caerostris extrusa]|uniref:Uncharacterized protein n=1 Tax=Caerostris extrusa TaxID=172846 RepID=A0AAV4PQV8_CAEEX|nr:hypothetical protein CEXT_341701 [Caerostris extrusa]